MACEQSYGFLPCSDDWRGAIFLMIVYGYFLLQGAGLLSEGSEMLLEVLNPGVVGGLLLPVLGALPDALIIIIAGMGSSDNQDKLIEEVSVGMGTLAGSTVMLLTIAWGGSLILGRCDLDSSGSAINKTLTQRGSLTATGVTSDAATPFNAVIMVATSLLYFIIQVPQWLGNTHPRLPALVGLIACFGTLALYCTYQVLVPELQKRRMTAARSKMMRQRVVHHMNRFAAADTGFGSLVDSAGQVRRSVVDQLFHHFDRDGSGSIDAAELEGILTGLELCTKSNVKDLQQHVEFFMKEFDTDNSGQIKKDEFFLGMQKWVDEKIAHMRTSGAQGQDMDSALLADTTAVNMPLVGSEQADDEDEEPEQEPLTPQQIVTKASLLLLLGTVTCGIFADPLVGVVTSFANAVNIPAFFVAFVVAPLASNASELVSSLKFAMAKKRKNISLTFCQVYGAVTMNCCLCLGLFLTVVYTRGLDWTFGPEVLSTVIPTLIMGLVGASSVTFKSWVAIPVFALYPAALVLVYVLKHM